MHEMRKNCSPHKIEQEIDSINIMFFGNFRESKQDCKSVTLYYTTPVIRELVRFCYTNEVSFRIEDARSVKLLGVLLEAGTYFEMSELLEVAVEWDGQIVFVLLQELIDRGLKGGKLWGECMKKMNSAYVEHAGVEKISLALLETIFEECPSLRPETRISALQLWHKGNTRKWQVSGQGRLDPATEAIKLRLQKLADETDLEGMYKGALMGLTPCPFFPLERLQKALWGLAKKELAKNNNRSHTYYRSPSPAFRPNSPNY